jgi:glucosamine--fructose-6-phosphate aminotransferase (isomerizing)
MCGIVGIVSNKSVVNSLINGLKSLEYRGYDSAGIAAIYNNEPINIKQVGQVELLNQKILNNREIAGATIAIGHTRWATHGAPTTINAHPHSNSSNTIFVVHNGIIENYKDIKVLLEDEGYKFISDTDTEVIPHLIDHYLKSSKDFKQAFASTLNDLLGAYAIAVLYTKTPSTMYVARLSSPLLIGVGDKQTLVASDASAIINHTKKVIYLKDYEMGILTNSSVKIHNFKRKTDVIPKTEELDFSLEKTKLGRFPNYLLKEVFDSPETLRLATAGRVRGESNIIKLGGLESVSEQLKYIDRIVIVACGTSYYAGLVGEYLIEEIAGIPVEVQLASEFKYRSEPFSRSTALIAISQSGETADTIAAIKKVKDYGVLRLGIVNAIGSTISRITDAGVYCHAGPELSVASTKAFIAQVTVLTEIALSLSNGNSPLYKPIINELLLLPEKIASILENTKNIESIAKKYSKYNDFIFMGRGYAYPCALEGALKLKELTYIHAEGYAAGEMKHGPLAMIDENFPTFVIATDSSLTEKTLSNISEIKARSGPIIALATEGNKAIESYTEDVIYIPKTLDQTQPLIVATVLHLFAYYMAITLGRNVDRPRNLAKSVTVE